MLDIFERYHGHADYAIYDISVATETKKAAGTNETDTFDIQVSLTMANDDKWFSKSL